MALNKLLKSTDETILYNVLISENTNSPKTTTLYIYKSGDNGTTWVLFDSLDFGVPFGDEQHLDALVIGNEIHAVFSLRTNVSPIQNGDIYYQVYNTATKTFSDMGPPAINASGHNPDIALNTKNDDIIMVYEAVEYSPTIDYSIRKKNLMTEDDIKYIRSVENNILKYPKIGISSLGDTGIISPGTFVFYYEHNGFYSIPKLYNYNTYVITIDTSRPIAFKETYELKASIYINAADEIFILYPTITDNSNNDGSGSFTGFSTVVDLAYSSDLMVSYNIETIFDISETDYYIHTSVDIIPHNDKLYLGASAFKDDLSDYDNSNFGGITLFAQSGSFGTWSDPRTIVNYTSGSATSSGVTLLTDNNGACHISSIQKPAQLSNDNTYSLNRHVLIHSKIEQTDFSAGTVTPPVLTDSSCILSNGSPETFSINVPEDLLRVERAIPSPNNLNSYYIDPTTGNIYVAYNNLGEGRQEVSWNGGAIDVYDYKTKELLQTKTFGGACLDVLVDPNGRVWVYIATHKDYTTDKEPTNTEIQVLNGTTLAMEYRLFATYGDEDPSSYPTNPTPGSVLDTRLSCFSRFGTSPDGVLAIVDDYVWAYTTPNPRADGPNGSVLCGYEWNNLSNLPATTDFVAFDSDIASETYTINYDFGAGLYPYEIKGIAAPSWYDTTSGNIPVVYLPNIVLQNSVMSPSFLSMLLVNDYLIISSSGVFGCIDLGTYPWGYSGELIGAAGQIFRDYRTTNINKHVSVTDLTKYSNGDNKLTKSQDEAIIHNKTSNEIYVPCTAVFWNNTNQSAFGTGFAKLSTTSTGELFDFTDTSSGPNLVANSTINTKTSSFSDIRTREAVLDECQQLWVADGVINISTDEETFYDFGNTLIDFDFNYIRFKLHPITGSVYAAQAVPAFNVDKDNFIREFKKNKIKNEVTDAFYTQVNQLNPVEWWKTEDDGTASPITLSAENNSFADLFLTSIGDPNDMEYNKPFELFPSITGVAFNGADGFITNWSTSSPDQSTLLNITGDMTFCIFVKLPTTLGWGSAATYTLIDVARPIGLVDDTGYKFGLYASGDDNNKGGWAYDHGDASISPPIASYVSSQGRFGYYGNNYYEVFLTFTRDASTKKVKFYVNSILQDEYKYSANATAATDTQLGFGIKSDETEAMDMPSNTNKIILGCPIIFDKVLTKTQIRQLYNAAKGY